MTILEIVQNQINSLHIVEPNGEIFNSVFDGEDFKSGVSLKQIDGQTNLPFKKLAYLQGKNGLILRYPIQWSKEDLASALIIADWAYKRGVEDGKAKLQEDISYLLGYKVENN